MLTDKEELLCHEYLLDLNQTRAYMRVYPDVSYDSARTKSAQTFANGNIRARIRELMDARSKDTLVDAKYVVDGLNEVYQRCMEAHPVMIWNHIDKQMEQKTDGEGNGVWEFDSQGANKALELLGKHVAMFTEKSEVKTDASITPEAIQSIADKLNSNAGTR